MLLEEWVGGSYDEWQFGIMVFFTKPFPTLVEQQSSVLADGAPTFNFNIYLKFFNNVLVEHIFVVHTIYHPTIKIFTHITGK